jgi:hypothetical protein
VLESKDTKNVQRSHQFLDSAFLCQTAVTLLQRYGKYLKAKEKAKKQKIPQELTVLLPRKGQKKSVGKCIEIETSVKSLQFTCFELKVC